MANKVCQCCKRPENEMPIQYLTCVECLTTTKDKCLCGGASAAAVISCLRSLPGLITYTTKCSSCVAFLTGIALEITPSQHNINSISYRVYPFQSWIKKQAFYSPIPFHDDCSKKQTDVCTCSLDTIMNIGCKCGQMQREKNRSK